MSSCNIVVVGSCMVDFTSYAPRLPQEGETIHGYKFATSFGGKGANQCVAAAKLGGQTTLVARVGDDVWGERYIKSLKNLSVNASFVQITPNCTSGIAQINVSDSGANQIIIVAAANQYLSGDDVNKAHEVISNADVVICQLETSTEASIRAMELCRGISILNGAPAMSNCDKRLLTLPTIFCVNESEASIYTKQPIVSISDAETAANILLGQGCNTVIITLGIQGAVVKTKTCTSAKHVPTKTVDCVDSTGAGDAFIGALAYCLAKFKDFSLEECIKIANYVAADSVTKAGTQLSFPGPEILDCYFNHIEN